MYINVSLQNEDQDSKLEHRNGHAITGLQQL